MGRRHTLALEGTNLPPFWIAQKRVREVSIVLILGNIHEENKDVILNGGKTWLGEAS